jgi:hypothetical protein
MLLENATVHVEEHSINNLHIHNEIQHHLSQTRAQSDRLPNIDQNQSYLEAAIALQHIWDWALWGCEIGPIAH